MEKRGKDNALKRLCLSSDYTATCDDNQVEVGRLKRPEEWRPTGPRKEEARRWSVRRERRTIVHLEKEKQRRRTVIATTSPRAGAKVPNWRNILDPGTVYCAELPCSLAWLRSMGRGGAFRYNDASCWDSCMRSAPESTWICDPEVVNQAKITDKPVRSVRAAVSRSYLFDTWQTIFTRSRGRARQ